jgi:hypothetical protein
MSAISVASVFGFCKSLSLCKKTWSLKNQDFAYIKNFTKMGAYVSRRKIFSARIENRLIINLMRDRSAEPREGCRSPQGGIDE